MTSTSAGDTRAGTVTDPATVAIVTLGCARNEVDSDQLSTLLTREGYRVVTEPEGADVVLVNTCTFITPATEESVETVLAACDLKDEGTRAVFAVGCMAERYQDELAESVPEVDAVVGFGAYPRLPTIIGDALAGRALPRYLGAAGSTADIGAAGSTADIGAAGSTADIAAAGSTADIGTATGSVDASAPAARDGRLAGRLPLLAAHAGEGSGRGYLPQDELDRIPQTGPRFPTRSAAARPWSYLKIASGCDRTCTFCAIPSWRGGFRSRPMDEIVREAEWLVAQGARELVLVSENTTSWGKDLDDARSRGRDLQPKLLEALADVDGLERMRLMYLQPDEIRRPLLEAMTGLPQVASYFDLSLQHVSETVLRRMSRSGSPSRFRDLVDEIRDLDPDAVFRSNFIVGFPGETEDDVADLASFLEDARLDWVGMFTFSPQDGTRAPDLEDQVPQREAERRLRELTDLQERVADANALAFVGRRLEAVVQETDEDGCYARSYREAPETDGEIRLVLPENDVLRPVTLPVGRIVTVEVVAAEGVDLIGVPQVPDSIGPMAVERASVGA